MFAGYLGDLESERSAEQWFRTGDLGYLDANGYLYVVDRRDDMIISGGENIYPAEIERVLVEHPLVADAGVVGVASDAWGSRPVAAVVWRGDSFACQCGTSRIHVCPPGELQGSRSDPRRGYDSAVDVRKAASARATESIR